MRRGTSSDTTSGGWLASQSASRSTSPSKALKEGAPEGHLARQRLVEHHPDGVPVAGRIEGLSGELLRRPVVSGLRLPGPS